MVLFFGEKIAIRRTYLKYIRLIVNENFKCSIFIVVMVGLWILELDFPVSCEVCRKTQKKLMLFNVNMKIPSAFW